MGLKRFFRKIEKTVNRTVDKVSVIGKFRKSISRAVRKNPLIKAVAMAALIYFTAGAALGAAGSVGAGGGFWSGVGSGLSSAASGLTSGTFLGGAYGAGATGAAGAAAPAAAAGFTGAGAAELGLGGAADTAVGGAAATGGGASGAAAANAAQTAAAIEASAAPAAAAAQTSGITSSALDFLKSQGGNALISGGLKLAGGAMADRAAGEEAAAAEATRNRNLNVGSLQFAQGAGPAGQRLGPVPVPGFDPYQQIAPGLVGRRIAGG